MLRSSLRRLHTVGFIGLGQMGARMVPNLFKDPATTEVLIFDTNQSAMDAVIKATEGKCVKAMKSPVEVAKGAKKVVTMLPNTGAVRAVYLDVAKLLENAQDGTIFIDSSTIDPHTPKEIAALAAKRGLLFSDAPLSGGVNAAASGQLTFMVGADKAEDFEKVKAILGPMAKAIVHCGPVGSGIIIKLCNNLILGQALVGVSEAMLLGTRLGVDPKVLASTINSSTGNCWTSNAYNPFPGVLPNVPASRNYEGGFGSSLMLKDLRLALDAAKSVDLAAPGGSKAQEVYADMCEGPKKMGNLDCGGVLKYLDETSPKK